MAKKKENCRKKLLISAGRLFAEYGYEGVTTRMISQSAGIRLSAIHYYFSSKENLFLETFRYAHDKENRVDFLEVLSENPQLGKTRKGHAEIIRTTVLRYFHNIFNPERPSWEARLLIRELIRPSAALPALAEEFMKSNVMNSEKYCKMINPAISDAEAAIWADTLFSHVFFYIIAKKPIEMVRGEGWLTEDFFHNAARMIARFMILELGLPLPDDLTPKHSIDKQHEG